jgi:hypothetical protein
LTHVTGILARERKNSDVIADAPANGMFASTSTESAGSRRKLAVFCGEFMIRSRSALIAAFTAAERDYIRRELDQFFSTLPTVAEGRTSPRDDRPSSTGKSLPCQRESMPNTSSNL